MVSVNFQQANTVHLNEGNGRFVALDRGPLTESSCKSSCAVFDDLSNDGKIDLFIGDEGNCLPELYEEGALLAEQPWELVARFANAQMRGDLAMADLLDHPGCAAPQQRAELRDVVP